MSVVIVVCVESVVSVVCQMEISEISRILVERVLLRVVGPFECVLETSMMRTLRLTRTVQT